LIVEMIAKQECGEADPFEAASLVHPRPTILGSGCMHSETKWVLGGQGRLLLR